MNHDKQKKGWIGNRILPIIGVPLVLLGFVGFVIRVYQKISTGHGLDTYFTGWFAPKELNTIREKIINNRDKIMEAWYGHCGETSRSKN